MVRLKADLESDFDDVRVISIPYGAIKSLFAIKTYICLALFQFLMVRLKDHIIIKFILPYKNFNSLWCD